MTEATDIPDIDGNRAKIATDDVTINGEAVRVQRMKQGYGAEGAYADLTEKPATEAKQVEATGSAGDAPPALATNASGLLGWSRKIVDTLASVVAAMAAPVAPVNRTATGNLLAIDSAATINAGDLGGLGFYIPAFTSGSVVFEGTVNGTTWGNIGLAPLQGGDRIQTLTGPWAGGTFEGIGGGIQAARVRVTSALNASITVNALATDDPRVLRVWNTSPKNFLASIYGSDDGGTTPRLLRTDSNGIAATNAEGVNFTPSVSNNSTANLASGATFTGSVETCYSAQNISILAVADQPFTVTVRQFSDAGGTKLAQQNTYVSRNNRLSVAPIANGNYCRVLMTNTGTATTTALLLDTQFGPIQSQDQDGNLPISIGPKVQVSGANATVGASTTLDLLTGQVSAWFDAQGFNSASFSVITDGTHATGAVTFEATDDTVFSAASAPGLPVVNEATPLAAPTTTTGALGANVLNRYACGLTGRFVRARLSAVPTAGNIRVTASFSQLPYNRPMQAVRLTDGTNQGVTLDAAARKGFVQLTDGTNSATVKAASTAAAVADLGQVVTVSPNDYAPIQVTDVASAAITTTTTTATITPTGGTSYEVNIPVTAVTGTTPTMDVGVEESDDGGTNWFRVYDFPRITAIGMYRSPKLPFTGNRVRYVQTIGGTTPSFTRAVNRLQAYDTAPTIRQIIDRSIVLTTLNSTTPTLDTKQTRNVQLVVNVGAITTTAPALQLEGTDDNGATWYAIGSPLTAVASSTVQLTANNIQAGAVRARISTAGVGVTAGFVLLKGF